MNKKEVEKQLKDYPMALTVKEAAAMQEASKKTGKFLCIGYQLNYRRDVQALKRDILLGRFGKAKHIAVYHGFRRGRLLCTQQLGRADHLPGAGSIRQSLYKRVCPSFSDADLSAGTDNAYSL